MDNISANLSTTCGPITYYSRIPKWSKNIIDQYKDKILNTTKSDYVFRDACKFLVYLNEQGINSFYDITIKVVINYRIAVYERGTTRFLHYLEELKFINHYVSNSYDTFFLDRIKCFEEFVKRLPLSYVNLDEFTNASNTYLEKITKEGYSRSIINSTKQATLEFGILMLFHNFNFSIQAVNLYCDALQKIFKIRALDIKRALTCIGLILDKKSIPPILKNIKQFPSWFEPYAESFFRFQTRNHIKQSTSQSYLTVLRKFSYYLDSIGIKNMKAVSLINVKNFYLQDKHKTNEGKNTIRIRLKLFLRFLHDESITETPLYDALNVIPPVQRRPTYTIPDKIYDLIIQRCNYWEQNGEYLKPALLKIELWTGLRPIDIGNLQIDKNIDWNNKEFRLFQMKTNVFIRIPFPTGIGNLIYLYLKYQRPAKAKSSTLFVHPRAPYEPIDFHFIRKLLLEASNGKISKTHMMRKTFASRMLRANISLNHISESLGHVSNMSIDPYLDTNTSKMLLCGITLDSIKYEEECHE